MRTESHLVTKRLPQQVLIWTPTYTRSWATDPTLKGGRDKWQSHQNSHQPSSPGPGTPGPGSSPRPGFLSQAQAPPTAKGAKRDCPSPQKWAHPTSPEDYRVEGTKALGWGSRVQHLQLQKMRPPRHYQYSHAGSGKLTD